MAVKKTLKAMISFYEKYNLSFITWNEKHSLKQEPITCTMEKNIFCGASSLQTHPVYSTLKHRGNGRFHVCLMWSNTVSLLPTILIIVKKAYRIAKR